MADIQDRIASLEAENLMLKNRVQKLETAPTKKRGGNKNTISAFLSGYCPLHRSEAKAKLTAALADKKKMRALVEEVHSLKSNKAPKEEVEKALRVTTKKNEPHTTAVSKVLATMWAKVTDEEKKKYHEVARKKMEAKTGADSGSSTSAASASEESDDEV